MAIPVIDIFAGPGGLGEGFSSILDAEGNRAFKIALSIEKERYEHQTLTLRSFYRQFRSGEVPEEYYQFVRGEITAKELNSKFPVQARKAKKEAWRATLGSGEIQNKRIDDKIRKAIGDTPDWLLIGGPPCQAYSLVGRSRRQWGDNLDATDKRVHLYKEYLRIIAVHHPAVFVMENVKGLLSSRVDGVKIFDLIKQDLRDPSTIFPNLNSPSYKIYSLTTKPTGTYECQPVYRKDIDYLIRSEEYGLPQKRHRVILLGIREDIELEPEVLKAGKTMISLSQVIGDLPRIRSGINRSFLKSEIVNGKKKRYYLNEKDSDDRWQSIVRSFRNEIISWNGFAKDYDTHDIDIPVNGMGSGFVECATPGGQNPLQSWYRDTNLQGACNHESRSHLIEDLKRYMFCSMFTKTYKRFPRLHEFDKHSHELLPDHENAKSGKFADRFRVQLPDQPATTVTSHISKDGHYFIHYDPDQCRSLTVREAARIQTFPDNYFFCGPRTAQYHQVGNAVPPFLAKQIAKIVNQIFITLDNTR